MNKIAIIGATGATGLELTKLAVNAGYDEDTLLLIASQKSVGKKIVVEKQEFIIQPLSVLFTDSLDTIFLAAGSKISSTLRPQLKDLKVTVIDLSSVFRQQEDVPLIIPEINPEACDFTKDFWITSPNCVTTLYLMVLAPLFKVFNPKKTLLSTYQAASGAGYFAMEELQKETQAFLNNEPYSQKAFQDPYAFNLFTHNAPFLSDDDNEEEIKIRTESQKILSNPNFKVSATCVRVPTLRAHAISAYVEFETDLSLDEIHAILDQAPGIKRYDNFKDNRFATPQIASCQNDVYYGRIRKDPCQIQAFWFWIVGDQLLKGAALNAWQIFLLKAKNETLHFNTRSNSPPLSS
jgi:aspartate-semialdehyde dehydrogenase